MEVDLLWKLGGHLLLLDCIHFHQIVPTEFHVLGFFVERNRRIVYLVAIVLNY